MSIFFLSFFIVNITIFFYKKSTWSMFISVFIDDIKVRNDFRRLQNVFVICEKHKKIQHIFIIMQKRKMCINFVADFKCCWNVDVDAMILMCHIKCMQFNVIMWECRCDDESLARFSTTSVSSMLLLIMRCIIGILIRTKSYFQLCIMRTLESYFHDNNRAMVVVAGVATSGEIVSVNFVVSYYRC